jgi:hypothetical protein
MSKLAFIILLFISSFAAAQTFVTDLQTDLKNFYESSTPLKISIVTNQPSYAPGDTLFYKINLLTAQRLRPVAGRSILTVLLFDGEAKNVSAQYVSVKDGFGNNYIAIPATSKPGIFCLKIFNDWMLNGPSELLFTRFFEIGIGGPSARVKPNLNVYAEGNVIQGLNTRFVTTGKPFETLTLRTASGTDLSTFATDKNGFGEFYLTPAEATNYEIVTTAGEKVTIPDAKADGVGLIVNRKGSELHPVLTIPSKSKHKNELLHLVLSAQGEIVYGADVRIKGEKSVEAIIKTEGFPPGISQLTVFNDRREVLASRLVYIPARKLRAEMTFDKEVYFTREKVNCSVRLFDDKGKSEASSYSVAAFNNDLTPYDNNGGTIESELLVGGDLGFESENSSDSSLIDQQLITSTWNRFNWETIQEKDRPLHYYNQNLRFSGMVVDENTGTPVRDSTLISFFLQNTVVTYQAYTDNAGKFDVLMLLDFYDEDEIFYKAEYKGKVNKNIKVILDPVFDATQIQVPVNPVASLEREAPYALFSRQKAVINNSYYYYNKPPGYLKSFKPRASIVEEVYGPDLAINLKDYLLFPTMSETLREIVPLVQHRNIRGVDVISVFNQEANFFPDSEPVFVIDGVMTDDVRYFLGLAPTDVISIKILYTDKKVKGFGPIGNGGIIVVDTKIANNYRNVPRSKFSLNVRGLNKALLPSLEPKRDERTPDLRTTIHWDPFVVTNKDGAKNVSFTTSDIPGNYLLVIEGLTYDGHPYSFTKNFQVKVKTVGK